MNFWPTDENILRHDSYENDINILKTKWANDIQQMEDRKKRWKEQVKDCPTMYQYLKELHKP